MIRVLLAALLAAAASGRAAQAQGTDSTVVITFADVGQGDATLIRTPEGRHILIDAGGTAAVAQRMFAGFLPDTLDLVIASHNHADHIGGMPWVFQRFVVRAYMDNGVPHTTNIYARTIQAVEREPDLRYLEATERTVTVGSVTLRILPPPRADSTQNNNSVGVVLEHGQFRALFTGDSETEQLDRRFRDKRATPVHVLKAAHHGAFNGATAEWIAATRPQVVVVSVSSKNSYGHPDPLVVMAWTKAGAVVHRTDREGDVSVVARHDGSFRVLGARRGILSTWASGR